MSVDIITTFFPQERYGKCVFMCWFLPLGEIQSYHEIAENIYINSRVIFNSFMSQKLGYEETDGVL